MVVAELHRLVAVLRARHVLLEHAHRLEPQHDAEAARRKAWRIADDNRLLAEAAGELDSALGGRATLPSVGDHLDELHHYDGIEEVHADQTPWLGQPRGDLADGERRGVRGQQGSRRRRALDFRKETLLEREILDDGFDDDVDICYRLAELRLGTNPLADRRVLVRRQLPPLDAAR